MYGRFASMAFASAMPFPDGIMMSVTSRWIADGYASAIWIASAPSAATRT